MSPADAATYDELGRGYSVARRTDPRIAAHIEAALGEARTVLNIGAGTGSYEPGSRELGLLVVADAKRGDKWR